VSERSVDLTMASQQTQPPEAECWSAEAGLLKLLEFHHNSLQNWQKCWGTPGTSLDNPFSVPLRRRSRNSPGSIAGKGKACHRLWKSGVISSLVLSQRLDWQGCWYRRWHCNKVSPVRSPLRSLMIIKWKSISLQLTNRASSSGNALY
jgi:hypothetical protein